MSGLQMKYFVLKPRSKDPLCPYAKASRKAMLTYAANISSTNRKLARELSGWAIEEQNIAHIKGYNKEEE